MLASCMHQQPPWHFLSLQPNCKQPICTHQRWKLSQQQECYSAQQPACLKWALPSKQSCFLSDCVDRRWLSGYIIFFGHYTLSSCNSTQRFADTRHERWSIAGVWTPQLSLHLNAPFSQLILCHLQNRRTRWRTFTIRFHNFWEIPVSVSNHIQSFFTKKTFLWFDKELCRYSLSSASAEAFFSPSSQLLLPYLRF